MITGGGCCCCCCDHNNIMCLLWLSVAFSLFIHKETLHYALRVEDDGLVCCVVWDGHYNFHPQTVSCGFAYEWPIQWSHCVRVAHPGQIELYLNSTHPLTISLPNQPVNWAVDGWASDIRETNAWYIQIITTRWHEYALVIIILLFIDNSTAVEHTQQMDVNATAAHVPLDRDKLWNMLMPMNYGIVAHHHQADGEF